MTTLLILAGDDVTAALLTDTAAAAGYTPARLLAGEAWEKAVGRAGAGVVLMDVALPFPPDFIRRARHAGTLFILVSNSMSTYELSTYARNHGVTHFVPAAGPAGLIQAVGDATALSRLPTPRRSNRDAAAASVQRARALAAHAGDVLATSNELRIANEIALAACRMNRRLLEQTVTACTRDLRQKGMALELVVELVTSAVEGSAVDHPASRAEVEAEAAAAARWCIEAYRAA